MFVIWYLVPGIYPPQVLNKQIAAALNISEKTVKVHRARVYKKAGVDSLAQLVRYTERVGIKPVNLSN